MLNDFLAIHDLSLYDFNHLLDMAGSIKESPQKFRDRLDNKIVAFASQDMPWQNRLSWEAAILQLGGRFVLLDQTEIDPAQIAAPDLFGKLLESWMDAVLIGAVPFSFINDLAQHAAIPIINTRSDHNDPVTVMGDFFTLRELRKNLADIRLVYAGSNPQLCRSLLSAAEKTGCRMTMVTAAGEEPKLADLANEFSRQTGFPIQFSKDPIPAVQEATVVYTDSESLLAAADTKAVVFYSPPNIKAAAHIPKKFTAAGAVLYDQIENKLHIQKAIMVLLLEDKK